MDSSDSVLAICDHLPPCLMPTWKKAVAVYGFNICLANTAISEICPVISSSKASGTVK